MDCNMCEYISCTEQEQQEQHKLKGKGFMPHICTKYNKRILHMHFACMGRYHSAYLYPCEECDKKNE